MNAPLSTPPTLIALDRIRACLFALLAAEMLGVGGELLLISHWEGWWQRTPLVLLAAGLILLAGHAICRNRASLRLFQLIMVLFALGGCLGLWMHYHGRAEFRLEVDPSLSGWNLVRATVSGSATPPLLAPGVMIQMGCLGLVSVYRQLACSAEPVS